MNQLSPERRARVSVAVPLVVCLLLAAPFRTSAQEARETWTSVRSKNFLFMGDAGERDIRRVAVRLEQFRDLFSRLLARDYLDSNVPTTIFVFKTDAAYKPFKPLYQGKPAEVAGHFQPGADVDYMTLSIERQRGEGQYFLVLHEYVHLLVKNYFHDAPLFFNEGLAEYYSTLRAADAGRRVTLGRPTPNHLNILRKRELLPLETLLQIKHDSPFYNEPDKRKIFYAQSWAFVHFLLSDEQGRRRAQLSRYLDLQSAGASVADAFHQAFQTDFATLDNELKNYVTLALYPEQTVKFEKEFDGRVELESRAVTEAEAQTLLGDLLLHTERFDAAESYLQRALALDPDSSAAHTSLGLLRLRQNRLAEAKDSLRRATDADPQNYLAHYHYASALSREGMDASLWVTDYAPEAADLMRAELKRAIELAPRYVESYRLLAFVNLVRDERLDEAIDALRQAQVIAPKRHEISLLLAQIHLRREEFDAAQQILEPLAGERSPAPRLRAQAASLLASIVPRKELAARRRADNATGTETTLASALQPCDMSYSGTQHKRLRFEGEQRCGMLVRVECDETGVVLFVRTGDGAMLKLRNDALNRIRFITYTADVKTGQITCGLREPANPVLVTFRTQNDAQAKIDGEVIAVEFVPKDWYANN
jgi:tetratricopeptide (TPR) repeat protein